ncbi:MAG: MaoC/PaaZ C-terminal domain-containing protein [Rhodoferax sp.]
MQAIEVTETPSLAATFFRALGTGAKRPGLVKTLPPAELVLPRVQLNAQHIGQYSALCGFHVGQGVPLIYPQLLTFPLVTAYMCSDACPWPAMGTVHLANTIEQHKPLFADDVVRVEMGTGSLFAHEKGQGFTLDLRILRGDELVWSATQSLLRVGVKETSGAPYASQIQVDVPLSCQTEFSASADIGRRYGAVSGDRNPIHMSALSARLFGFKRAIAHGMWTNARALSCLLPAKPVEQARLAVEFKTPLYLPGRASLWSARSSNGALFEVRDAKGQRPHLRGQFSY